MNENIQTYLARQPIFDRDRDIAGYELLYRDDRAATSAEGVDDEQMTSDVLLNAFVSIGMDRVTAGEPAFVNMDREMLLDGTVGIIEPGEVVVELLESVDPDRELIRQCRALASRGYSLALDDFEYRPELAPLLEVADYVKLDVLSRSMEEVAREVKRIRPFEGRFVAERVESSQVRSQAEEIGFELFQGHYFHRPETLSGSDMPVRHMKLFRLLNLLRDPEVPDTEIEEIFRGDPSLTYKLLRIVNSAAVGGRGVDSIGHAIRMLGRDRLHRWMSLLLVSSMVGQRGVDQELAETAVQRGRFLELLARKSRTDRDPASLFLVGLFSLIDALLDQPMEDVLEHMELSEDVVAALLYGDGPLAPALELVRSYEAGRWDGVSEALRAMGTPPDVDVSGLYLEALSWSRERLESAGT